MAARGDEAGDWDDQSEPYYAGKKEAPVQEWREDEIVLPPYPQEEDLKPLPESRGGRFEYLLDTTSINKGADSILRYTVVVRSPSGAANVFYEGCRCSTKEYKTYAFGNPQRREMRAQRKPRWRLVKSSPSDTALGFRTLLMREYICNADNIANDAPAILSLLHHRPVGAMRDSYD